MDTTDEIVTITKLDAIKITEEEDGTWLMMPLGWVGWYNMYKIDKYIFKNLKKEIKYANKINLKYTNLNEILSICKNLQPKEKNYEKEKRKIEIILKQSGKKNNNWLSFPEVGNYNSSIYIDKHIFKNLDFEIEWAKKHNTKYTNLNEVINICEKLTKINYTTNIIDFIDDRKTYLMKDNHTKLYKIGFSNNPKHRETTLQSEKPSIKMVKIWNKNIERKLHKLYSEYRVRGEWFNLTPVQVKYICTQF